MQGRVSFYYPRDPDKKLPNASSSIRVALLLMDWARKSSLVPRIGSPAAGRLRELLEVLGNGGTALLETSKAELTKAKQDLKRVREKAWRKIDLTTENPKSTN